MAHNSRSYLQKTEQETNGNEMETISTKVAGNYNHIQKYIKQLAKNSEDTEN